MRHVHMVLDAAVDDSINRAGSPYIVGGRNHSANGATNVVATTHDSTARAAIHIVVNYCASSADVTTNNSTGRAAINIVVNYCASSADVTTNDSTGRAATHVVVNYCACRATDDSTMGLSHDHLQTSCLWLAFILSFHMHLMVLSIDTVVCVCAPCSHRDPLGLR